MHLTKQVGSSGKMLQISSCSSFSGNPVNMSAPEAVLPNGGTSDTPIGDSSVQQDLSSTLQPENSDHSSLASSSSNEYYLSDDDEMGAGLSDGHERLIGYSASIGDHSSYLSQTLSGALDSVQLDKSLVTQAQLSGQLNNYSQKLIDKRKQVLDKLQHLQLLYKSHFSSEDRKVSKLEQLQTEIHIIETKIAKLKNGSQALDDGFMSLFKSQKSGVAQKFPIEYNQARDKVIERQIDE